MPKLCACAVAHFRFPRTFIHLQFRLRRSRSCDVAYYRSIWVGEGVGKPCGSEWFALFSDQSTIGKNRTCPIPSTPFEVQAAKTGLHPIAKILTERRQKLLTTIPHLYLQVTGEARSFVFIYKDRHTTLSEAGKAYRRKR